MSQRTRKSGKSAKRIGSKKSAGLRALAERMGDAKTIVYVHGIGNKPVQSVLKCQWDNALFGFDLGERSRLAYWVSRTRYPDPSGETCKSGDVVRTDGGSGIQSIGIAASAGAWSVEDEVSSITQVGRHQEVLKRIARRMNEQSANAGPRAKRALSVGARVLPVPEALRRLITRRLTDVFLHDVHDFFFVPARRASMRESVLERLRPGGGPFIVIAHSQGSIVAYDALLDPSVSGVSIRLFVTIGSPLGMTEVQDQLRTLTHQRSLRIPTCVESWINVADPLDPVAIDKRLSAEFSPHGTIDDDPEWNPDSPRHPHSGTGYLRTSPVQRSVHDTVDKAMFQPVADFVIARDMHREMEDSPGKARHEVLIELAQPMSANGESIEDHRKEVLGHISDITKGVPPGHIRIENLRRFIVADLTREEAETLATKVAKWAVLPAPPVVEHIWKNARKRALLDVSGQTVQAWPAHAGYQALGRGVHWALLDSGIAPHPHFTTHQSVVAEYDCTERGKSVIKGAAIDQNGHGTHVAGIIAGRGEYPGPDGNPRILSGMAPETKLHIYKVLDRAGNGDDASIIKALDHIAETNEQAGKMQICGVNLSLGGPFDQSAFGCGHSPLCWELRRLWRQGVVLVIAAGNEGFAVLESLEGEVNANMDLSIGDPGNLDEAIVVGSIHKQNPHTYGVSYFSSRGPTADGRQKPDLVAPGERILSCRHKYPKKAAKLEQLYVEMSGTSMAAPHVSGIIAAFLSIRREFIGYPDRVKEILLENCTDLKRDRSHQGAGMPNLVKMLVST